MIKEKILCDKCKTCHFNNEKCVPLYEVLDPDYNNSPFEFATWSFELAAIKFANYRGLIPATGRLKIKITNKQNGETREYQLSADINVKRLT